MSSAQPSKQLSKAVRQYADELTSSVRSVAADHIIGTLKFGQAAGKGGSFVYRVRSVPLGTATLSLSLSIDQTLSPNPTPLRPNGFSVTSYAYHLRNEAGNKLVRWEYSPDLPPKWPHVHIEASAEVLSGAELGRHHLPTGRVLLEDVLRYLVHDCGVAAARGFDEALVTSESWFAHSQWGTARGNRQL